MSRGLLSLQSGAWGHRWNGGLDIVAQPHPQLPLVCLLSWFAERVLPLKHSSTPLFCSSPIMLQVGRLRPGWVTQGSVESWGRVRVAWCPARLISWPMTRPLRLPNPAVVGCCLHGLAAPATTPLQSPSGDLDTFPLSFLCQRCAQGR